MKILQLQNRQLHQQYYKFDNPLLPLLLEFVSLNTEYYDINKNLCMYVRIEIRNHMDAHLYWRILCALKRMKFETTKTLMPEISCGI